jgi:acetyl-CoA carboxylase biotin carboxyl carrier protein
VREAVNDGEALCAPTPGRWLPAIGLGAPLRAGLPLGVIEQAGRAVPIVAPPDAAGVAVVVYRRGAWVAYGAALVRAGEGTGPLAEAAPTVARAADLPADAVPVTAETDGTVYLRAAPDKPAFVTEGAEVAAHATLALVEVMKTFTPVRAPMAGTVVRIAARDGAPVEAGATLFWMRPTGV